MGFRIRIADLGSGVSGLRAADRPCDRLAPKLLHAVDPSPGDFDVPGLVLALDRAEGAACTGVAFRVATGAEKATADALRERELVSSAYFETRLVVETADGALEALTYVIDPDHVQYCRLDLDEQARIIAAAAGGRGPNRDYLWSTAAHLADLGIADPDLEWLATRVRTLV